MFVLTLSLLALACTSRAQSVNDNDLYHTFGSVVFIRSGERTPTSIRAPGAQTLTSLGAQQMLELGANFRRRYLTTVGEPRNFGVQNIEGMSSDILNSDQLYIQTVNKPYLVSSAQAFMQGLYPPHRMNISGNGRSPDPSYTLSNGTNVDFPLDGYQYPNLQVLSPLDPRSIYIDGLTSCPTAIQAGLMYRLSDEYLRTRSAEKAFYSSLSREWFGNDIDSSEIDYRYAGPVYEQLSYAYKHNPSAYSALSNSSSDTLMRARTLADKMAYYTYANTTTSTTDRDYQAMAGKTLAALILGQLQRVVDRGTNTSSTTAQPLTLLFGDSEPMTSFFDLAMVHQLNDAFKSAPSFASAMVFELFTLRRNSSFPADSPSDLLVRFYFHNGTDASFNTTTSSSNTTTITQQLPTFSLFNQGASQGGDMKWPAFQDMMQRIMMNQAGNWCSTCNSGAFFCTGLDGSPFSPWRNFPGSGGNTRSNTSTNSSKVSPAVAGVIGAIVALVVAGLLFAAAMLLAGIRLHRNPSSAVLSKSTFSSKSSKPSSSPFGGGFKGSAKLASDPDLSLAKNAAAPAGATVVGAGAGAGAVKGHERVGSWELRQKEFGKETRGDDDDDVDAIEEAGVGMGRVVEPVERV
ncbi:phosphoglycerate mutase-like protein [Periconia macrospinosa]|uniref:Phosphoglycerate mutase-like protein n=1 Tax=Periconia macrospinosa TaxID=97972 RepID=A0A2V1DUL5_9PLEO|nr:phosphoglycerate mutase-like protein [Periconia macrospinosa]